MRNIRKYLIIALSTLCVSLSCVGIGLSQTTLSVSANEAVSVQTHGASVRTVSPAGLRFMSSVPKSVKESGTFGTLIIPKEILGGDKLNHNADTADNVALNYTEIAQTKWATEAVKELPNFDFDENREYFNAVLTEIPTEHYGTELVACAYALIDGTYYYSTPVTRSIGWVSAAALADGETDAFLVECVDTALASNTLAMESNVLMDLNDEFTLSLTGNNDYAAIWTTSAEDVATVDKNGKVTAVAEGSAVITAKLGSKTVTSSVTVKDLAEGDNVLSFTSDTYAKKINADLYNSEEGHGTLAYDTNYVVAGQAGAVKITSKSFYVDFKLLDGVSVMTYEKVSFAIYNPNESDYLFYSYQDQVSQTLKAQEWTVITYETSVLPVLRESVFRIFKNTNYDAFVDVPFYITDFVATGVNNNVSTVVDFTEESLGGVTVTNGTAVYENKGGVVNYTSGTDNAFTFDLTFNNDIQLGEYKSLYILVRAMYNGKNESGVSSTSTRTLKTYAGYNNYGDEKDFSLAEKKWNIVEIELKAGAVLKGNKIRLYAENWGKLNGDTYYIADIYGEKYDTLIDFTAEHVGFTSSQGSLTYDTAMTYGSQSGVLNYTTNNSNNYAFDLTFSDSIDLTGYTSIRFIVYAKYNGVNESGESGTSQRILKTYSAYNNGADTEFALTKEAWTVVDVNIKEDAVLKGNKIRFHSSNWGKWNGETFYIADVMGIK